MVAVVLMKENEHESEGEVLLCLSLSLLSAYLPPVDDVPGRQAGKAGKSKQSRLRLLERQLFQTHTFAQCLSRLWWWWWCALQSITEQV